MNLIAQNLLIAHIQTLTNEASWTKIIMLDPFKRLISVFS